MSLLLTVLIFVFIGLFGLYDFQDDYILLNILHSFDVAVLLMNLLFIRLLVDKKSFRGHILNTPLKYIFWTYSFVLLIIISMPFRGEISVLQSLRVGREFLLLPLVFLVSYDLLKNNNLRYYRRLFLFIAIFTSFQIIINSVSPEFISNIFEYVRARQKFKYEFQRNDFISKSMLFPHFASLLIFSDLIKEKKNNTLYLILFLFFFLAAGLQGFRSYFVILCIAIVFYLVRFIGNRKFRKYLMIFIIILPVGFTFDYALLNKQVVNKFLSIPLDFERDEGSTTVGRMEMDLIYTIPMFLEKPYFGWGFVHHNSEYGKKIGLKDTRNSDSVRAYTLYSIDSGYISMLNYFGVFGCFVFLFFYWKLIKSYKIIHYDFLLISSFSILFLSLPTHGAFYSDFGLIPFLIILSLVATNPNYGMFKSKKIVWNRRK